MGLLLVPIIYNVAILYCVREEMLKFGTDGWRAVIADEFTFANVRLVAKAVALYAKKAAGFYQTKGLDGICVGYDARFLSKEFAHQVAAVIASQGIRVWLSDSFCATPAFSWAVVDRKAIGGVVITASHNPPVYNGFKFKAWYGGSASPEIIADIEKQLRLLEEHAVVVEKIALPDAVEFFSPQADYLQHIKAMLKPDIISGYRARIVFDMMYGSSQGLAKILADEYGLNLTEFRGTVNPGFDGVNPEPIERYLSRLRQEVLTVGADFALATDGDGDRIGAMSSDGSFISAHHIIALLSRYLIDSRGWSGSVVKTVTVSGLVDAVVALTNREMLETPVGFKYIAELMNSEDVLLGGEESGGIGIKNYIPERDGLLLGMLLVEMCAFYDKPLGKLLTDLMDEVGHFCYHRDDISLAPEQIKRLMDRLAVEPEIVAGMNVLKYNSSDGVKMYLQDNSWVMVRGSGTEPILRVYADAPTKECAIGLVTRMVDYARSC